MRSLELSGTYTPVVTPFTADSSVVDYDSLGALLEFQLRAGVQGIVACGSTGEAAMLDDAEYAAVVRFIAGWCRGKLPCIAGIGTNSTRRAVEQAKFLRDEKLDGTLLTAPPYVKPTQRGIIAHFCAVREAGAPPIVAYNIPGRAAVAIAPETLVQLARDGVIVGIKDSSGQLDGLMDVFAGIPANCAVLSGEDSLVAAIMGCGGRGVISASANLIPEKMVAITAAALAGDLRGAAAAQTRALPMVRALFSETNPIPVKYGLFKIGVIRTAAMRLPLMEASEGTRRKVDEALG